MNPNIFYSLKNYFSISYVIIPELNSSIVLKAVMRSKSLELCKSNLTL